MLALVAGEGARHTESVYSVAIHQAGGMARFEVFFIAGEKIAPAALAETLRKAAEKLEGALEYPAQRDCTAHGIGGIPQELGAVDALLRAERGIGR
jgi:hypothetical protein